MKSCTKAILLAFALSSAGCTTSVRIEPVLIGGERPMFYPSGKTVPEVPSGANTNGWYSLSARDFNAIVNP